MAIPLCSASPRAIRVLMGSCSGLGLWVCRALLRSVWRSPTTMVSAGSCAVVRSPQVLRAGTQCMWSRSTSIQHALISTVFTSMERRAPSVAQPRSIRRPRACASRSRPASIGNMAGFPPIGTWSRRRSMFSCMSETTSTRSLSGPAPTFAVSARPIRSRWTSIAFVMRSTAPIPICRPPPLPSRSSRPGTITR